MSTPDDFTRRDDPRQVVIASARAPRQEDWHWEELLAYIRDARVVPIVGPDLVEVEFEGELTTFDHYLAVQLTRKLGIDPAVLPANASLHDVVCVATEVVRRYKLYMEVQRIVEDAQFALPRPLQQLAEIADFRVFVTTTLDSQLERAINEVRFGGEPRTQSIAYKPKGESGGRGIPDIEEDSASDGAPVVYHLFGKPTTAPEYVICDEDMVNFVSRLQQDSYQPQRLFDLLGESHLLLLGVSLPDWLARFFLHIAKAHRPPRESWQEEMLADRTMSHDAKLALYLQHFSQSTKVYPGTPVEFVSELWQRWRAQNPAAAFARLRPPAEMPKHAIFISYAREDSEAVYRLKERLEASGLVVWFDADRLEGGDRFAQKIFENIGRCLGFVPVISRNTTEKMEGFFRREWHWASERAVKLHEDWSFIVPVRIDPGGELPEAFRPLHMIEAPAGEPPEALIDTLREMVDRVEPRLR
jgi:hypothetical protein